MAAILSSGRWDNATFSQWHSVCYSRDEPETQPDTDDKTFLTQAPVESSGSMSWLPQIHQKEAEPVH